MRRQIFALTFVAIAAFLGFANYWTILGWLRGEGFYNGRPTSYWESELEQWQDIGAQSQSSGSSTMFVPSRGESLVDVQYYDILQRRQGNFGRLTSLIGIDTSSESATPTLMDGDPAAEPVLSELLVSESEHVRFLAEAGLQAIRTKAAR